MSVSIAKYNTATKAIMGEVDLTTTVLKLALLADTYMFDAAHDEFADVSAHEIAHASYTPGGNALAGKTLTEVDGVSTFDADDLTFAALTATFKYGILYADATVEGYTKPVLACITFDATAVSMAGIDFVVRWNAAGILYGS